MDIYIGLDVSLASTSICVLGEKGKIVTEAQVASTPEALVAPIAIAARSTLNRPRVPSL